MKSIELFAGAGGLGIGLHQAGFHPERVVERDRYCCDTIRENQVLDCRWVKGWDVYEGDVRHVDFRALEGKVQLVSGGPPCQPFSLGGKHQAYDDARDMFPQAIRVVQETQPQAFVFENVKGLTRTAFRNYFEYIKLQLQYPELVAKPDEDWADHLARLERHHTGGIHEGLEYKLLAQVLNAADYGVPQKRERVVFVGFRTDLDLEWCFPIQTFSEDALLWSKYRSEDYWDRHKASTAERYFDAAEAGRAKRLATKPNTCAWQTVRDAIADLPDPETERDEARKMPNHKFQGGARSYPGHTGSPLDEPAKALKAGVHGVPGGENMLARPDGSVRYFTVRESARLQTFPDDYVFHGSWSETMRQLGNAVPVKLARTIGDAVARKLKFAA
jgi:DNA (cytosine-5)-methyltransferase 1